MGENLYYVVVIVLYLYSWRWGCSHLRVPWSQWSHDRISWWALPWMMIVAPLLLAHCAWMCWDLGIVKRKGWGYVLRDHRKQRDKPDIRFGVYLAVAVTAATLLATTAFLWAIILTTLTVVLATLIVSYEKIKDMLLKKKENK